MLKTLWRECRIWTFKFLLIPLWEVFGRRAKNFRRTAWRLALTRPRPLRSALPPTESTP